MPVISVARHMLPSPMKGGARGQGSQQAEEMKQPPQPPTSGSAKVAQAVDAIAQFIPADLLGFYITANAVLSPLSVTGGWVLLVLCIALIPVLFWLGAKIPAYRTSNRQPVPRRTVNLLVAFSAVAFIAWALTLPNNPAMQTWGAGAMKISAVVAIGLAIILPLAARKLDLL